MESFKADQVDIEYLKQKDIGNVIAQGLAATYKVKPSSPIDFLSKWLLNYSVAKEKENQLQQNIKEKQKQRLIHDEEEQKKKQAEARKQEEQRKDAQVDDTFQDKIRDEKYHDQMIEQIFPDFLEQRKSLTGVYVGNLNFSRKEISDEDEGDEQAHLNTTEAKVINYIGFSSSHQKIMKNKILELEKGVTYDVFKEKEAEEVAEGEEGEVKAIKPSYVYIPDVVKEPKMHYFRLPKLGAYIAIPLVYNSCLSEASFDAGTEERNKYRIAKDEQDREREVKRVEFEEQLKEKQDAGEDTTEFENQFHNEQNAIEEVKEADFLTVKREYVVCADTLGQDREINPADRKYIEDFVRLYASAWEAKEKQLLSEDIDRQLRYIESLPMEWKEQVQNFLDLEEKAAEEKAPSFDEIKEAHPKEYEFEVESAKLERLKEILADKNSQLQDWFLSLQHNRVLKFPQILQNILYLLGYDRAEINQKNTHLLDWQSAQKIIHDNIFEKILKYSHRGSKPNKVKRYALVNKISQKLEKFDQEAVDGYNLGYGRLLRWIKLTCALRKQDIEIRRAKIEQKKADREAKTQEVEKMKEEKEKALADKQAELTEEEQEAFDKGDWEKVWDDDHPLPEIPEEVVDDVDEDCEFE